MPTHKQTQDELLKPVNGYQLQALSDKVDEIKLMIAAQNQTYPTRMELQLELEKRDSKIDNLGKTLKGYNKVVWTLGIGLATAFVASLWQLVTNSGRAGQ